MSFKLVWSTDWHVADQPPSNRIDDYTESCFNKITQIKHLCKAIHADICLIGGDVFHVKTSSKVRHALVARLIEMFNEFSCPVYSIVGNHDISHNNLITLPEKPLGVVFSSGYLHKLDEEIFIKDAIKIKIIGKHFDPDINLDAFDTLQKSDEDWLLVAYHGYANIAGVSYPGEATFKYSDLAKLAPDDWFFGHWHVDQGVETINGKNFINIGSLTRGALNLENIARTPKVVICTYDKHDRKIQQVKLRVSPAKDIFDIRKKERTDREQVLINQFIENLRKEANNKGTDNDIGKRLDLLGLDAKVKQRVSSLLEEAEVELQSVRSGVK